MNLAQFVLILQLALSLLVNVSNNPSATPEQKRQALMFANSAISMTTQATQNQSSMQTAPSVANDSGNSSNYIIPPKPLNCSDCVWNMSAWAWQPQITLTPVPSLTQLPPSQPPTSTQPSPTLPVPLLQPPATPTSPTPSAMTPTQTTSSTAQQVAIYSISGGYTISAEGPGFNMVIDPTLLESGIYYPTSVRFYLMNRDLASANVSTTALTINGYTLISTSTSITMNLKNLHLNPDTTYPYSVRLDNNQWYATGEGQFTTPPSLACGHGSPPSFRCTNLSADQIFIKTIYLRSVSGAAGYLASNDTSNPDTMLNPRLVAKIPTTFSSTSTPIQVSGSLAAGASVNFSFIGLPPLSSGTYVEKMDYSVNGVDHGINL